MDYQETIEFLFSRLPMFQRVGAAAYKADLSATINLAKLTGNPERGLKFLHIAGTNGKGSVANMCASVLQESGYTTGLFTSPHLRDFRERIRVNGEMISREAVIDFVEEYRRQWESIQPSFFEITFAMAIWYFKQVGVEIVVLETGMGGRLDSTNIVHPEVSVITSIGMDHTAFLGDTIEKIAGEKAGIIKKGAPVVIGNLPVEAEQVVREKARKEGTQVYPIGDYSLKLPEMDLKGPYQHENGMIAILALRLLKDKGWRIEGEHVAKGLASVKQNTGFAGRWQILSQKPLTIADCGHNVDGLKVTLKEIFNLAKRTIHFVIGFSGDKSLDEMLMLFPTNDVYYFCAADIPRALPADDLQAMAAEYGLKGEVYSSVRKAYEAARIYAGPEDVIFIGGSVFVVAEVV